MHLVCGGVDLRARQKKKKEPTAALRQKVKTEQTFREMQPNITLQWPNT